MNKQELEREYRHCTALMNRINHYIRVLIDKLQELTMRKAELERLREIIKQQGKL